MDISVILCTHNPDAVRLERVLEALRGQELETSSWECVVVDNASTPPLERLESGLPNLRVVREERIGLTPARIRGIRETTGQMVVFVDDDCVVAPDYLRTVQAMFEKYPFLGAVGGVGTAEYETPPPVWMNPTFRQFHLDMTEPAIGGELLYACVRKSGPWFPVGAGMAIRRTLAQGYADFAETDEVALSRDRAGTSLMGGGDTDMGIFVVEQGQAIGVSPRLRFRHLVPARRLEFEYMRRLLYMSQYSVAQLFVRRGWLTAGGGRAPCSLWQRVKALVRRRLGRTQEAALWRAFSVGYVDGRSGVKPDPTFGA